MNTRNMPIYLDYNATAPLHPAARDAIVDVLGEPLNASAIHGFGRKGRQVIEKSRKNIADLLRVPGEQLIFNSGATEGNNTVLKHFSDERTLVSAIEHPCVLNAAPKADRIPVLKNGVIDLAALEALLKQERTALVSVMLVNNETGVIQPVHEISKLAHRHGALFHCDGVQALGRIDINMQEMGIDFLTLSAHKAGGPQGIGVLAFGICGETPILFHGGGQEKYARAGTENVAAIAGFGALSVILKDSSEFITHDVFEKTLLEKIPSAIIHGIDAPRIKNTTLLSIPGLTSEAVLIAMDLAGIAVSNGSACTSGSVKPSHVLAAMNIPDNIAKCSIRISSGWGTKKDDFDRFIEVLLNILSR